MEEAFMALSPALRNSEEARYIPGQIEAIKATAKGATAPDFSRPDMHGKTVSLKDYRGKYVVLDFWGSWCRPCRASHPALIELYKKYHDKGLEVVGIAREEDGAGFAASKANWLKAIEEDGIGIWPQVLNDQETPVDSASIVLGYGIIGYPTKYLLDREGKVIGKYLGSDSDMKSVVEKLLAN
jgi:thiol-disulfide isomerase/thioredoxin